AGALVAARRRAGWQAGAPGGAGAADRRLGYRPAPAPGPTGRDRPGHPGGGRQRRPGPLAAPGGASADRPRVGQRGPGGGPFLRRHGGHALPRVARYPPPPRPWTLVAPVGATSVQLSTARHRSAW